MLDGPVAKGGDILGAPLGSLGAKLGVVATFFDLRNPQSYQLEGSYGQNRETRPGHSPGKGRDLGPQAVTKPNSQSSPEKGGDTHRLG